MSMVDISPEALERIVRIETKLDMLVEMLPEIPVSLFIFLWHKKQRSIIFGSFSSHIH